MSVCPQHNRKTKYPKVFRLGIGDDLGISYSYKWYGFGFERSKVKVIVMVGIMINSNTAWVRTP